MQSTLARWRENVLSPFDTMLMPFTAPDIRIEQVIENDQFVIRAELPGVEPDKDVSVVVEAGMVRIVAERTEEQHDKAHSEFHYGRMSRSIALPAGALEDKATARYAKGILEIRFPLGETKEHGRELPIEVAQEPTEKPAARAKK